MENKDITECSIMEEVREMRQKISAEFGHDFNRLGAYYQEIQKEIRYKHTLTSYKNLPFIPACGVWDNNFSPHHI